MPMINQPSESRFARLLKPFFDSIDPFRSSLTVARCDAAIASPDVRELSVEWSGAQRTMTRPDPVMGLRGS
jgi:hypothetical protein